MVFGLVTSSDYGGTLVPLCSVHVDVLVARGVSWHRLTQTYANTRPRTINAHYVFPLPESASVSGFAATFADGRRIVGAMREQEEAKNIFRDATRSGCRAALLEEHRPDVFRASIGNLGPGDRVLVELQYCCELQVAQDSLRLFIPSHVAPRYTPHADFTQDGPVLRDLSEFPTAKQAIFSARVCWETGGCPDDRLESPSHPSLVEYSASEPGSAVAQLKGGTLDTDLILTMKPRNLFQPVVMWEEWADRGTQAMMLSLVPKFELAKLDGPEVVFVIDCSGSMLGSRIQQAKQSLQICIQSLPKDSHFNIVKFGSQFTAMSSSQSVPCVEENVHRALVFAADLQADMGGTEMLQPLRFALGDCGGNGPRRSKQIILLTDGRVTNEQGLIDFVRCKGSRIFSLGIGSGVSTALVQGLARATQGHAAFVQDWERLEPVCASLLKKALTPAITNLRISWPSALDEDFLVVDSCLPDEASAEVATVQDGAGPLSLFDPGQKCPTAFRPRSAPVDAVLQLERLQQAPQRPPAIFADSHFCAFALYPGRVDPTGVVEITGETPAGPVALRVVLPPAPTERDQPLLHSMAARALIRDLEEGDAVEPGRNMADAVRLSLGFSVLCRGTAFVLVEARAGEQQRPVSWVATPAQQAVVTAPAAPPQPAQQSFMRSSARCVRPPTAVTNAVSWRSEGIRHKKNELFLDVIERMSYLIGIDGSVLQSEVRGALRMRCFLSGMPEIKLGLSRQFGVDPADLRFHQCARLARLEADRTLSLIPPDGESELVSYVWSSFARPPIEVKTVVAPCPGSGRTEFSVWVKPSFKAMLVANGVEIEIPLPAGAQSPECVASDGRVEYTTERNTIKWRVGRLQGQKHIFLSATFGCPDRQTLEHTCKPGSAVSVRFEIPGFSASRASITHVKIIEKSGYEAATTVSYCTVGELGQHRLLN